MRTDKYMMAKAWMKQDQAPQAEALETWNTLEAEFNEERKAMLMASAETDKIKEEMNKKFGPGTVKYGSELPPIQNPLDYLPINLLM
jgi:molecular chaperone GrpE (heat shock protein)